MLSSMIIDDLHVKRIAVFPTETDPVPIIHAHAVLSLAVAFQRFQPVGRRRRQVAKLFRAIDLNEPSQGHRIDPLKPFDPPQPKYRFGVFVAKRSNQTTIILRYTLNARHGPGRKRARQGRGTPFRHYRFRLIPEWYLSRLKIDPN